MAFAAGVMVLQRMQVHDRHEATGDMPGWEKRRRQIEEKKNPVHIVIIIFPVNVNENTNPSHPNVDNNYPLKRQPSIHKP